MNRLLLSAMLAALLPLSAPVASAGETKFRDVAPRSEHSRHYTNRHRSSRYDRYRSNRHYRSTRNYSRYRYRPHSNYVYRPLPAPERYSHHYRYSRYHYDPFYHHYWRGGDGLRISPHGITIFLDLDD